MKKRTTIRTILAVLLGIFLMCFGNVQSISAEGTLQIGIDQYDVSDEGDIYIYVNQSGENGFTPSISDSSILIGKNTLEIEEIKSLQEQNEPITYFCLIDISGSMTKEGIEQTQEILSQFVEAKGEKDNFCITTMGNDVQSSGLLTDLEELHAAIGKIERVSTEDTNLYYSITEAINELKTDTMVHKKRCLLIFSDGEDDQKKGITEQEAQNAVKENHIPVFTILIPGVNLKDEEGSSKILGSFARNSAGGEHYAPHLDDTFEYEDICGRINTRLYTSMILRASLDNIQEVGDDTVYIGVELSDGTEKAEDGITVPAGRIIEAIEAIEEAKGTEVKVTVINDNAEENVVEEAPAEEPSKLNKQLIIGIGLVVLVLIIILILILKNRKKNDDEDSDYASDDIDSHNADIMGQMSSHRVENTVASGDFAAKSVPEDTKKGKVCITLYRVGPGETESHKLMIKDKAVIGRDKSCQLSFSNDTAMSGKHCSIIYRSGSVFVQDEKSTNGTYVNGVPIVGEFKVEKDDILMIGSSEFRITWDI